MSKSRRSMLAVELALGAAMLTAQSRPVSMDRAEGRPVYLLDESGQVVRSRSSKDVSSFDRFIRLPLGVEGSKLLVTKMNGREEIFVATAGAGPKDPAGQLVQYSDQGEQLRVWRLPAMCAGIDADTSENAVYLAGVTSKDIYRIRINESKAQSSEDVTVVASLKESGRLGPLAIAGKGKIFVADVLRGVLYLISPSQGTKVRVADDLGQPVALAVHPKRQEVYIADLAGKRILKASILDDHTLSKPAVYASGPEFQEPNSLTVLDDGRVIVGDHRSGALFVLKDGKIIQRLGKSLVKGG